MAIRTKLTELLGIRHPVLLAPMSGIAGGALAAAVSGAGGLGRLGGGNSRSIGPDWLEREFAAAGNQRVGCGFITWALAERPEVLDLRLRHTPAALMLSFGVPRRSSRGSRQPVFLTICQVHPLAQARQALQQGADIIIAQGAEAGGHGAHRATLPLIPAVVDMAAASGRAVPVIAAGGIADGRGLAAALMFGAAVVLIGTRFYAAEESLFAREAKERIVAGSGDDTQRSKIFDIAMGNHWPQEYNSRTLVNRFTGTWRGWETAPAADTTAIAGFTAAQAAGDFDTAQINAGEGIDLIHAVEPAGAIVNRSAADLLQIDILTNVALPIEVDEVTTWRRKQPSLAQVTRARAAVPISYADMAAAYPGLSASPDAAKMALTRENREQTPIEEYLIGVCSGFSAKRDRRHH